LNNLQTKKPHRIDTAFCLFFGVKIISSCEHNGDRYDNRYEFFADKHDGCCLLCSRDWSGCDNNRDLTGDRYPVDNRVWHHVVHHEIHVWLRGGFLRAECPVCNPDAHPELLPDIRVWLLFDFLYSVRLPYQR